VTPLARGERVEVEPTGSDQLLLVGDLSRHADGEDAPPPAARSVDLVHLKSHQRPLERGAELRPRARQEDDRTVEDCVSQAKGHMESAHTG
jgi:hypothetical protein